MPCATPGCENKRVDGDFCPTHTQGSGDSDEFTSKQGCLGCLGVLGAILVLVMLWTAGGAVVDWVTGANDPNNEGSTAWCSKNGITEEHCGPLNSLAEDRDTTPSEYLASLEVIADRAPTPVVSDSDLLVAAVRLTVTPLYPAIDGVADSMILAVAREVCTLVTTAVADGVSPEDAMALVAIAVIRSDFADVGALMAGATLGAMETTTCSQHGGYIRQMLNSGRS
jgi:hypothetical protein